MTRPLIANITSATNIKASIRYDLIGRDRRNPRQDALMIACSLPTCDASEIIRCIQGTIKRHRRIKRPLYRVSLSVPAGVKITPLLWNFCAILWMRGMGLNPDEFDWYLVNHPTQTDHNHCHLTICRIPHSGKLGPKGGSGAWSMWGDYRKGQAVAQRVAEILGLDAQAQNEALPPSAERDLKVALKDMLDSLLSTRIRLKELIRELQERDVYPTLHINAAQAVKGVSFRVAGCRIKGSTVQWPWSRLIQRVEFSPDQDLQHLQAELSGPRKIGLTTNPSMNGDSNEDRLDNMGEPRTNSSDTGNPARPWAGASAPTWELASGHHRPSLGRAQLSVEYDSDRNHRSKAEPHSTFDWEQYPTIRPGACQPGPRRVGRCADGNSQSPRATSNISRVGAHLDR